MNACIHVCNLKVIYFIGIHHAHYLYYQIHVQNVYAVQNSQHLIQENILLHIGLTRHTYLCQVTLHN